MADIRLASMVAKLYLACPPSGVAWLAASVQSEERNRWTLHSRVIRGLSSCDDVWEMS